ncbi:ECF transporter S component [Abyssisolibacter fermentans]|uniref:ECF transporter S component n=1 Tax=Abyssisolibacter fermentans TaxID=1766203 RepID=UPI0008310AFD|nr:ECF transporter S component [Abyssisolibacter fermentans]
MTKKGLDRFSMFDLVIIAMMAALGIATKSVIVPLIHIVTSSLYIPGGVIAGGFYMLWIVMSVGITRKRGAATLTAFVQAIMVIAMGSIGTHGIMSLITYSLPGLAADIVFLFSKKKNYTIVHFFTAGAAANLAGTFLSNLVFFRLPLIPLLLSVSSGALSGGIGGLIAYKIVKGFDKFNIIKIDN